MNTRRILAGIACFTGLIIFWDFAFTAGLWLISRNRMDVRGVLLYTPIYPIIDGANFAWWPQNLISVILGTLVLGGAIYACYRFLSGLSPIWFAITNVAVVTYYAIGVVYAILIS